MNILQEKISTLKTQSTQFIIRTTEEYTLVVKMGNQLKLSPTEHLLLKQQTQLTAKSQKSDLITIIVLFMDTCFSIRRESVSWMLGEKTVVQIKKSF